MRRFWWKILGVLLLLYVTFFSLFLPLDPGILDTDVEAVHPGIQTIEVAGYNTHFQTDFDSITVLLEWESVFLCCTPVSVSAEDQMKFEVDFPTEFHGKLLNLYINTPTDGTIYLPEALRVEDAQIVEEPGASCDFDVQNDVALISGLPFLPILLETIRNLMFHVPMWFTMFLLMLLSVWHSVAFLNKGKLESDLKARLFVEVGLVFCTLGLITGSVWARFTWTTWWASDPQLNGALVTFLMYCAYVILRRSIDDDQRRATIAAVFNIFCFALLFVLLMILPRFTESLHPGKGGNPAFSSYDLDNSLRLLFYPAVIGWILCGLWIYNLRIRAHRVREKILFDE